MHHCRFANIFAAAIDAQTAGISYACATSLSVSGVGAVSWPAQRLRSCCIQPTS